VALFGRESFPNRPVAHFSPGAGEGAGFPDRQGAEQISGMARMAAIVDVYDAITADRCYHKGMPAAEALRKIYEWSRFHFNPQLVQAFMRCVGIYPVGTMVTEMVRR